MKRLSRNISSILGSDILRRLLGFAAVTYLARTIGTESFGTVNLGFTVLSYAILLSAAGLGTLGTRETARGARTEIVRLILGSRVRNSVLAFLLFSLLIMLFTHDSTTQLMLIVFVCALLPHALLLDWYYQGREQMGIIGVSRTTSALVYLILVLLAVNDPKDIVLVGVAAVAGDAVATSILLMRYHRDERTIPLYTTTHEWRDTVVSSIPLGAGSMLAQAVVNLPVMVVAFLLTPYDIGVYSAASKVVLVLLMFDRVLGTILLPASTRMEQVSRSSLVETMTLALKWVLVVALPLCVGVAVLAPSLTALIFGSAYDSSAIVLAVLIWFLLFTMWQTVIVAGLIAVGKEKIYAKVTALSAGISAVVITLGTIALGARGAAIGAVLGEFIVVALLWLRLRTVTGMLVQRSFFMIVVAAGVMGIAVSAAAGQPLYVSVPLGVGVYAISLLATRALTVPEFLGFARRFR